MYYVIKVEKRSREGLHKTPLWCLDLPKTVMAKILREGEALKGLRLLVLCKSALK